MMTEYQLVLALAVPGALVILLAALLWTGRNVVSERRFTPSGDIEDNGACFIVRDNNGQALSYVYYENEPGRRAAAGLLTRDEGGASPSISPSCRPSRQLEVAIRRCPAGI
jgi:hypothetical protein